MHNYFYIGINCGIFSGQSLKKEDIMKNKIISIFTTVFIISLLIMAGPARGINVDLSTDKTTYEKGDQIIFTASVDIQDNERIPARELRLSLNNATACVFDISGSILSGCNNMIVNVLENNASFGYGYRQGAGFGLDNGILTNKTTNFGYGYGYGYGYSGSSELKYKITWDSSSAILGDYEALFSIWASNGNSFEYLTEDSSKFKIIQTEINDIKEKVFAEGAENIIINNTSDFDKFTTADFNGDFRQKNLSNGAEIGGYGTLRIEAYKNDSTHVSLQITFDPETANNFNSNLTELTGTAKIDYQRTKRGLRINSQWVGTEPTLKFKGTASNAMLKIKDGKLDFSSNDPLFSFELEQMIIKKLDYSEYTHEFSFKNGRIIRKTNIKRVRIP